MLYGSRRADEILLKEELEALAASCDKVKVVHVLSDDPGAEGYEHGFITAELIKNAPLPLTTPFLYAALWICINIWSRR